MKAKLVKESLNEIGSDTFKSAMKKTKEYGQHNRGYKMGSLFFRKFQGLSLLGDIIKEIGTIDSGNGLVVQITLRKNEAENQKRHMVVYYVDKDKWEEVRHNDWNDIKNIDITRKDANILSKIAQQINPETKYKHINKEFSIDLK